MEIRPYDPATDRTSLWELKRAFELELGDADEDKRAAYEDKLTSAYRERYLDWVERCVTDEQCVIVADDGGSDAEQRTGDLVGHAFVLPESLAMVWDAAVLNEIYVRPEHRGTEVGDALMGAAITCAHDQSLPLNRMVLDVDHENERARTFYERHGFEPWGEMIARELRNASGAADQ